MKYFALAVLAFHAFTVCGEEIVFNVTPTSRVVSTSTETSRDVLTESKKSENRLLITKQGTNYFWSTRNNRPLTHSISGVFHIFSDRNGAGYVKIFDHTLVPQSLKGTNSGYQYLEQVHDHLATVTYWGVGEKFKP